MLKSMTGYGKSVFVDENYDLFFEMKSVNHKFLDINVRLPYFLNFCEDVIKNLIRSKLSRGRVDVFIRGTQFFNDENSSVSVNYSLAKNYYDSYIKLNDFLGIDCPVSLGNVLKNENVVELKSEVQDENYLKESVLNAVDVALSELISMRLNEGENLKTYFVENLNFIEENVNKIEIESPRVLELQIQRLREKLKEFTGELSESEVNRLNAEIIFYTDKLDIGEEISRLRCHIKSFSKYINSNEPIGKKMEFLLQEMNREINTIGSKSSSANISENVVDVKVTIEKLREQIQNIE